MRWTSRGRRFATLRPRARMSDGRSAESARQKGVFSVRAAGSFSSLRIVELRRWETTRPQHVTPPTTPHSLPATSSEPSPTRNTLSTPPRELTVMATLRKGEYGGLERERLANSQHRLYGYVPRTPRCHHRRQSPDNSDSGHRSNSFYAEDVNELGAWSCDVPTEPSPPFF